MQTRRREIPQDITLCPPTPRPASQGSRQVESCFSYRLFAQYSPAQHGPLPLFSALHPSGGGNVNTRQLPSTQHHRIASHATVLLHLTNLAVPTPRSATPYIYIYSLVPQPPTSPPKPVFRPTPTLSHLRTPGRARLLLVLLSQAISMGLGQLWTFQPPILQIPRSRLQADQLRLAGTSLF